MKTETSSAKPSTIEKHRDLLFALAMSLVMVSTISFANLVVRQGFHNLWSQWLLSLAIGYPLAIPLILFVPPYLRKGISRLTNLRAKS